MNKPLVNLDDVEFDDVEENGYYTSRRALFSAAIGARKLGYNLTELPPGKVQCPFHAHREEEEMFLILEGTGELRFGAERYPLKRHDVIACPTGDASVAHQIINTGTVPLRYLVAVESFGDGGLRVPGLEQGRHLLLSAWCICTAQDGSCRGCR